MTSTEIIFRLLVARFLTNSSLIMFIPGMKIRGFVAGIPDLAKSPRARISPHSFLPFIPALVGLLSLVFFNIVVIIFQAINFRRFVSADVFWWWSVYYSRPTKRMSAEVRDSFIWWHCCSHFAKVSFENLSQKSNAIMKNIIIFFHCWYTVVVGTRL